MIASTRLKYGEYSYKISLEYFLLFLALLSLFSYTLTLHKKAYAMEALAFYSIRLDTIHGMDNAEKRVEDLNWLTILAGNETKQDAVLGSWNTSLLSPGDYQLALVVVDNQGTSLPSCVIRVHVASVEGTPQP